MPAVQLVFDTANDPPRSAAIAQEGARHDEAVAPRTLLRWSRRSAADVMREYFTTEALQRPGDGDRTDGVGHVPRARRAPGSAR